MPSSTSPSTSFSDFCSLLFHISRSTESKPPEYVFHIWLSARRHVDGGVLFPLLFPRELDRKRVYALKEKKLGFILESELGFTRQPADERCLGEAVGEHISSCADSSREVAISELDLALSHIASFCPFSNPRVHPQAGSSQSEILKKLYGQMKSGWETAVLTQVILKDLAPLMYPNYISQDNSTVKRIKQLSMWEAFRIYDHKLPRLFSLQSDIAIACAHLKSYRDSEIRPKWGVPIEHPKCVKGQSLKSVAAMLKGQTFAETKYDGERMQIHVDLEGRNIRIFSKSKRDSTLDRRDTHNMIYASLGINIKEPALLQDRAFLCKGSSRAICKNIILEAEMVSFDERTNEIEPFYKIRSLIGRSGAAWDGCAADLMAASTIFDTQAIDSQQDYTRDREQRHLSLVFFDILMLDDKSLVDKTYNDRRMLLERAITCIPGYTRLASRQELKFNCNQTGVNDLKAAMALTFSRKEEGLVLKMGNSFYNDHRAKWIKIKADYIVGLADTADFVILGARHERDRARSLGVSGTILTTFCVGALGTQSSRELERDPDSRPDFRIIFEVGYGLTRDQLLALNQDLCAFGPTPYSNRAVSKVPYDFIKCRGVPAPDILFRVPLLFELKGDRFTRNTHEKYFSLRWPRIVKVHRDRYWQEGLRVQQIQELARESLSNIQGEAKSVIDEVFVSPDRVRKRDKLSDGQKNMLEMDCIILPHAKRPDRSSSPLKKRKFTSQGSMILATPDASACFASPEMTKMPGASTKACEKFNCKEEIDWSLNVCQIEKSLSLELVNSKCTSNIGNPYLNSIYFVQVEDKSSTARLRMRRRILSLLPRGCQYRCWNTFLSKAGWRKALTTASGLEVTGCNDDRTAVVFAADSNLQELIANIRGNDSSTIYGSKRAPIYVFNQNILWTEKSRNEDLSCLAVIS